MPDMAKRSTKSVEVTIAGREYRLSTNESSEYVEQLAAYVTTRILQVKREMDGASPLDCATLAAFLLADELNKTTEKLEKLTQKN